jgi:hypothetical protein
MKRKVKRYAEGGDMVEDYSTLLKRGSERADDTEYEGNASGMKGVEAKKYGIASGARQYEPEPSGAVEEDLSPKNFKAAFAEARRSGDKNFTYQGKKYTTELAQPKSKSKPDEDETAAERRMSAIGDKWREDKKSKQTVPAATKEEMDRRKKMEKDQALETVSPEMAIIGGPSLRAVKGAAEALVARQAAKEAGKQMGKRVEPTLRPMRDITPGPDQIGMGARRIGNEPLKIGMKKGGAVKKMASGGKTSSASSRGDGIAQRGKTRGRMC